jgi:ribosomal protein L19
MLNFFNFKKRLQYVIGVCISRKNKNFNTSIILCGTLLKTNFELTCFIYSPLIQKIEIYYNTNKINFNAILYKNRYYTKSKLYYLRAYSPKGLKK